MKAILPAAGFGTRMYPLTLDKPKALLEINGKPVIEYIIDKIIKLDVIDEIFVVTNNKFYDNFIKWKEKFNSKIPIRVINDNVNSNEERLGTIGDIWHVLEKDNLKEDFIVVNADNLFSFNLTELYKEFLRKKEPMLCLYDVNDLEIAKKKGNVEIDKYGKLIFFREKPDNPKSTLCTIGIYFFPRWISAYFKKYLEQGNLGDRSGDFIEWLYKETSVYGYVFDNNKDFWFDIGSKESYEKAQEFLNRQF